MENGREAAQRVHEFLMNLESNHTSFITFNYYHRLNREKVALRSIARLDIAMERKTSRIQKV